MSSNEGTNKTAYGDEKSSTGLEPNIAGLVCYLFGFVSGIIFLIIEKDSKFVKFHAMQSTITWVVVFVLSFILGFIPLIGWVLAILLWPVSVILWIVLMIKAYQGSLMKLPIIGNMAAQQLKQ